MLRELLTSDQAYFGDLLHGTCRADEELLERLEIAFFNTSVKLKKIYDVGI
jgi:hypothetical protein